MSESLKETIAELSIALQERSSEYRELYEMMITFGECAPNLFWAKDLQGRYIHTNKAHRDWLGCEDPEGKCDEDIAEINKALSPYDDHYHDFGVVCGNSDAATLKLNKKCRFLECGNVRGKYCALQVIKSPLKDKNGNIAGTVGSAVDITERTQTIEGIYNDLHAIVKQNGLDDVLGDIVKRLYDYCDRHKFTEGQ